MNFLQIAMVIGAASLLVMTAVLLIVQTLPSRKGVGWWVIAAFQQLTIYILGAVFFGGEESVTATLTFFFLQMCSLQALSIGMMLFIENRSNIPLRLATLLAAAAVIVIAMTADNKLFATYIFAIYLSITTFYAAISIWRSEKSTFLLNLAALFFFLIGLHWLDFPILGSVEWFVPIGFLLGIALVLGVYFSLAAVAMLQFKHTTNDSKKKAIYAATHDPLTGVYNRSHLPVLFDKYKTKLRNDKGTFILLYIDLDGFKAINDTFGHKAGDEILIVVTKRLKSWLGSKGDVIRIGGDEIVVINLLRSDANPDIVYGTYAAQSILKLIEEPIVDGKNTYNISASIGGCYDDAEFDDLEAMLSKADELMYSAKQAGRRRVHFGNIPNEKPSTVPASASNKTVTGEAVSGALI